MKFQLICCLVSHSPPAMLLSPANNIRKELHWCYGSWLTWFRRRHLLQMRGRTLLPHGLLRRVCPRAVPQHNARPRLQCKARSEDSLP